MPGLGDGKQPALADSPKRRAATHGRLASRRQRRRHARSRDQPRRAPTGRQQRSVRAGATGTLRTGSRRYRLAPTGTRQPGFFHTVEPVRQGTWRRKWYGPEKRRGVSDREWLAHIGNRKGVG